MEQAQTYEEYIGGLAYEALAGIISPEDKLILEKEIRTNKRALAVWEERINFFESPAMQQFWENRQDHMVLPAEIAAEIAPRHTSPIRKIIRYAIAAAASVIVVMGGMWFLQQRNAGADKPRVITGSKGITLQVAGGKEIALSNTASTVKAGDVILNNSGKDLKYETTGNTAAVYNTLSVPAGMNYQLNLADGSKIWLNSATTLQFPFKFAGNNREITITGEAYLDIAADPAHPFLVHLPGGNTVQVLGTTFNVNTYDSNRTQVALVTGAVKVQSAEGGSVQLKPGLLATESGNTFETATFDADNLLAWREGKYYFNAASIQEVADVIARWYGVKVIIDSPGLSHRKFSGSLYRNAPLEKFLNRATQMLDASYYYEDGVLHIK